MEELLNKLIEKGWKPRGYENCIRLNANWWYISYMEDENRSIEIDKSIRDLTAKESWLWQFVCKNDLLNIKKEKKRITPEHLRVFNWEYQYRLIESALCDEDKLEDFLLQNIKVNE